MRENHKSFFERIVFLPFDDRLDVELAYAMNKYWFRAKNRMEFECDPLGAEDQQIRYFEHLRRVALILLDEVKLADPALIISALCHDALEDTKEDDFASAQIEKRFGKDVIWIVKMLSKCPKEGYLERLAAFADWRVLLIKACDRLDNLRSLKFGSAEFQEKQLKETRKKYYPLFDRMVEIAPADQTAKAKYLRDEIHKIVENFVVEDNRYKRFPKDDYLDPEKRKYISEHLDEYGSVALVNDKGEISQTVSIGMSPWMKEPFDKD